MARSLRPMDLMAEDAGDDYLVILPELNRAEGQTAMESLLDFARGARVSAKSATAQCPEDGTTVETLIGAVRQGLRTGRTSRELANAPTKNESIILDPATKRVYSLVDRIADEPALSNYHLLPGVRGDLLQKLGRHDEARAAFETAAALAGNRRDRDLMQRRAREVS